MEFLTSILTNRQSEDAAQHPYAQYGNQNPSNSNSAFLEWNHKMGGHNVGGSSSSSHAAHHDAHTGPHRQYNFCLSGHIFAPWFCRHIVPTLVTFAVYSVVSMNAKARGQRIEAFIASVWTAVMVMYFLCDGGIFCLLGNFGMGVGEWNFIVFFCALQLVVVEEKFQTKFSGIYRDARENFVYRPPKKIILILY